jgi:hypothetical protein
MRTIKTPMTKVDDVHVEIEVAERRHGFPEPFVAVLSIEHHGNPGQTAADFHKEITKRGGRLRA